MNEADLDGGAEAALKREVCVLGVDEGGVRKGVFQDERVHMAVVGFPGTGKTRFLLSLAFQNIRRGEGCMVIDPHGDLARLVLSHVPRERWGDVIYIDPTTAIKYGRVVKINFLEYRDHRDRDVVARSFMDSLEKIYARFWGPRLDMIMLNAVYLLLDSGNRNLTSLYRVIADESFREMLLSKAADQNVVSFWTNEFKRMPRDASSAVLTKIYRLIQERIVAPMFDCERSRIDFRKIMDEGRIVIVNLSEGAITSDIANFLGSLILAKVYLAGMSREDVPESQRRPFYIYVDEAYRFVTAGIRDILQSLRKYKVFMALASQYLEQYEKTIASSIPSLCDTIICFSVGEETARTLEEFYKPALKYADLMRLPRHYFAASAIVEGRREIEVLKTIDYGHGPHDPEEVIKHSLQRWGDEVDVRRYTGAASVGELPHPSTEYSLKPLAWIILVHLYRLYEEEYRKGGGISTKSKYPSIGKEGLTEMLKKKFGATEAEVADAVTLLYYKGWLNIKEAEVDYEAARIAADAPYQPEPLKCVNCELLTNRPFILRDGRALCKPCLERLVYRKRISIDDVLRPEIRESQCTIYPPKRVRAKRVSYSLDPEAVKQFFMHLPKGKSGGGPEHARAVGAIAKMLNFNYYAFCFVDTGEEKFHIRPDGSYEYEVKKRPDMIVYPLVKKLGAGAGFDHRQWDNMHVFFVEVEIDPVKHRKKVLRNLAKCRNLGKPVLFATTRLSWARSLVKILLEAGEKIVFDCTGLLGGTYSPNATSVLFIDLETGTRTFITSPDHPLTKAEKRERVKPIEPAEKTVISPEFKGEAAPETIVLSHADWRMTVRKEPEGLILYANKLVAGKMVKMKLGPLEEFREALEKLHIPYSFEPAEEPTTPEKKASEEAVKEHVEETSTKHIEDEGALEEDALLPAKHPEEEKPALKEAEPGEILERKEKPPRRLKKGGLGEGGGK